MEKNVIDDTAVFGCSSGIGVRFKTTKCQNTMRGKEHYFLNADSICSLVLPGQCKKQPNPSGPGFLPCMLKRIPVNSWQDTDPVIKLKNSNALLDKSYTRCPAFGGKIRLENCRDNVFKSGCTVIIEEKNIKNTELLNENNIESPKKNDACDKEMGVTEKNVNSEYAKCPYEECRERDECQYYNAKAFVDNNSAELKKNYERDRVKEDTEYKKKHYEARKQYPDYAWSFAGHHIISGNQVFMDRDKQSLKLRYGHLLMLASMCGYDINNAYNCVLLPTMVSREGAWGSLEKYLKMATAFDVMDIMKRQWHVGGHAYTVPKDSLKYYKPTDEQLIRSGMCEYFPNYATAVKAELDKLNDRYSRKRCWKRMDTEKFRTTFAMQMEKISAEIEKHLLDFSIRPKDSYPFFVSKVAVDYAYDAPKTGKIILIYQRKNNVYAAKFRISRMQKNNYQIIVTQNENLPEISITEENMHDFVIYCDNVVHFWIESNLNFSLPWDDKADYVNKCVIDGESIYKYACDNCTQLFAYIDNNEIANQGQIAKIRKRWKEVEKNAGNIYD